MTHLNGKADEPYCDKNTITMNARKHVSFVADLASVDLVEKSHLHERVEDYREMCARCSNRVHVRVDNVVNVHEILN